MMTPYYQDDTVTLLLGDAAEQSSTLEPQSVQTVVTSPPYFGLRDYGVAGQLGAESSPAEFVANLVAVFDAIRPALADDGTLWVNLGDSYSGSWGAQCRSEQMGDRSVISAQQIANAQRKATRTGSIRPGMPPAKNLLGIPWRFAFAMQDAGWVLRNDIIWAKPNGMPESVRDRFSTKHEHVFLFAKSPRYWFDLDAVRRPFAEASIVRGQEHRAEFAGSRSSEVYQGQGSQTMNARNYLEAPGANPGDWWEIATRPFSGAHFAVFPPEIPERCILSGSRPGDAVLDPFSGSGTTGMVATKHGRRYVGIDLNADYHQLALRTRLAQGVLT
jgi:site-specific DNA-methyltransferase (cytosine-N4-specific)